MSNHENQGTGYDSGAVGHETVGRADRPEPLSTGFERVYAEIHGEPVKPFTEAERRKFRGSNCFICGYNGANYFQPSIHACARRYHADEEVYAAALESAVERLQRELDEARARRVTPFSELQAELNRSPGGFGVASLMQRVALLEARALAAEASLANAREALKPFAEQAERYDPHEGDDDIRAWDSFFTIGDLRAARAILGDQPT